MITAWLSGGFSTISDVRKNLVHYQYSTCGYTSHRLSPKLMWALERYKTAEENEKNTPWSEALEQYQKLLLAGLPFQKVWTESLEPYSRLATIGESYLKSGVASLKQFQQTVETIQPSLTSLAESLEQYQKILAASQPYLKLWMDSLEQYLKMVEQYRKMGDSFLPHSDRPSGE